MNFADLGTQKIALPALRSSVIRTSNRDGGEPFKALVPDCAIPESLGETCAMGGMDEGKSTGRMCFFFLGRGAGIGKIQVMFRSFSIYIMLEYYGIFGFEKMD